MYGPRVPISVPCVSQADQRIAGASEEALMLIPNPGDEPASWARRSLRTPSRRPPPHRPRAHCIDRHASSCASWPTQPSRMAISDGCRWCWRAHWARRWCSDCRRPRRFTSPSPRRWSFVRSWPGHVFGRCRQTASPRHPHQQHRPSRHGQRQRRCRSQRTASPRGPPDGEPLRRCGIQAADGAAGHGTDSGRPCWLAAAAWCCWIIIMVLLDTVGSGGRWRSHAGHRAERGRRKERPDKDPEQHRHRHCQQQRRQRHCQRHRRRH